MRYRTMLRRAGVPRLVPVAIGAIGALTLAGCQDILEVEDPEFRSPEELADPAALPALIAGAIGDFQVAYSGGGLDDKYVTMSGVITDELRTSDTFTTRVRTDQRLQFPIDQGNTTDATYVWLQRARRSLDRAATIADSIAGEDESENVALLRALQGYTYVALAEGFCSGIPLSGYDAATDEPSFGMPLATAAVLDSGIVRFDQALAIDPDHRLAAVGKARALMSLANANLDEAAALVEDIPTTWVHRVEHSENTDRQQNAVFNLNISNRRYTMADNEGGTGAPFRSADDPRTPWRPNANGVGFDRSTPMFDVLRYPEMGADVPLASGVEARLIEAEAALFADDVTGWLDILNDLRDSVQVLMPILFELYPDAIEVSSTTQLTLAPLADPGTAAARRDLMFRERGFWLYLTGHRLGDFRRLMRNYGLAEDAVFPTGDYHKGGTYGNDVNFPIAFNEANNPHWEPSMCSTTTP